MHSHLSHFWSVVAWISLISWWKICIQCICVVWEKKRGGRPRLSICFCFFFSLGINWCVAFACKLSETLQVQTPAVPPGSCQPPRLVGKPKAREVQLRWGESFLCNSDLCGMYSSFRWCIYLSSELPQAMSFDYGICILLFEHLSLCIYMFYFFLENTL